MPRLSKCPKCSGTDIEIIENNWICWDCDWEEVINEDDREFRDAENREELFGKM